MLKILRNLLLLVLLLGIVFAASAQEDEELPVIPYITSAESVESFNIPIPDNWENVGTAGQPHLVNDGVAGDIYIVTVGSNDIMTGQVGSIQQILPDFEGEPRATGELNLDGDIWTQSVFDLPDGDNVTAFSVLRDEVVYSLVYVNQEPDSDFYMVAVRPEGNLDVSVDSGVAEAMRRVYPDFDGEPETTSTVELSNGTWTLYEYDNVDNQPVSVLGQLRGNTTFVVIERGTANKIETVNKAFYTVLWGFFVTPQTQSYLTMGMATVFGTVIVLVFSMFIRFRNLQKDEALIRQLAEEA